MQKVNFSFLLKNAFYYTLITASILSFLFAISIDLKNIEIGNDIKVFCNAGEAIASNKNPYITANIGGELSWNYPTVIANIFAAACPSLNLQETYIFYFTIPFLLGLLPWLYQKDVLYGFVLLSTGLFNIGWVILTGNISTFEFLLFSIATFLLLRKQANPASFVTGIMSGVKLIPILYFPALIFLLKNSKEKIKSFLWVMLGFAAIPVLSLIFSPEMFPWYIKQILGLIPNQHAPINELTPDPLNPSFAIFLFSMFQLDPSSATSSYTVITLFIYLTGAILAYKICGLKIFTSNKEFLLFPISIIILTLVMPRLKPYSFLPYLLCFYLLSRHQSHWLKGLYLTFLTLAPTFLHIFYYYGTNNEILLKTGVVQSIILSNQFFFACIAAGALIFSVLWNLSNDRKDYS